MPDFQSLTDIINSLKTSATYSATQIYDIIKKSISSTAYTVNNLRNDVGLQTAILGGFLMKIILSDKTMNHIYSILPNHFTSLDEYILFSGIGATLASTIYGLVQDYKSGKPFVISGKAARNTSITFGIGLIDIVQWYWSISLLAQGVLFDNAQKEKKIKT